MPADLDLLAGLVPVPERPPAAGFVLKPFADIEPETVGYLWPRVIPFGKLTIVLGDPGWGKSYVTVDVAARVSAGRPMPDGTATEEAPVLLVFCEDGAGDTVRPRLDASGADVRHVYELTMAGADGEDRLLNLDTDLAKIEAAITRTGARVIVLDPLNAYLGTKANSWKDDDMRRLLGPLARMAERTGVAILGVMHLNKKQTANVLQRATGSGAFGAVARSVVLVGPHPEDAELPPNDQRRVFAPAKMNLGPLGESRTFRIGDRGVRWEGETTVTARDMAVADMTGAADDGKLAQAIALLQAELAGGPRPAAAMLARGRELGISEKTVRRAKDVLGVVSRQEAGEGDQRWTWRLPDPAPGRAMAANEPGGHARAI